MDYCGDESIKLYCGPKVNKSGIWPLGLGFHTGRKSENGRRVFGLQIGLILFSFWIALKTES